jgi:hypothetical protein
VTFDPFGDFEIHGYLRNLEREKDPAIVKRLEHASFTTGIDEAYKELDDPGKGILDDLLKPYIRPAVTDLSKHIADAKDLAGGVSDADKVYGRNDDPAVQAEYNQQRLKRAGEGHER